MHSNMKRKNLYNWMMVVVAAVVSLVFVACGDDNKEKIEEDLGVVAVEKVDDGTMEWFDPCLQWGCLQETVAAYMKNDPRWTVYLDSVGRVFYKKDNGDVLKYHFLGKRGDGEGNDGLNAVWIIYKNGTVADWEKAVARIDETYHVKKDVKRDGLVCEAIYSWEEGNVGYFIQVIILEEKELEVFWLKREY